MNNSTIAILIFQISETEEPKEAAMRTHELYMIFLRQL